MDDDRSSRAGWEEGDLVVEMQSWRRGRQRRVYVAPHDDALC